MSDEDSFDAEAAMRQAMGFTSFAVRRPKQETGESNKAALDGPKRETGMIRPHLLTSSLQSYLLWAA